MGPIKILYNSKFDFYSKIFGNKHSRYSEGPLYSNSKQSWNLALLHSLLLAAFAGRWITVSIAFTVFLQL